MKSEENGDAIVVPASLLLALASPSTGYALSGCATGLAIHIHCGWCGVLANVGELEHVGRPTHQSDCPISQARAILGDRFTGVQPVIARKRSGRKRKEAEE